MSLFIGNVSKKVTQKQFEDAFKAFGKCKVDLRVKYAFVQYQNERNAEDAKQQLQNMNFSGLKVNIQWSKNSGRFNQNNGSRRNGKRKSQSRQRSWRKQERWHRRSPSYEKRSNPTYSDNEDYQNFVSQCPRDVELLRRIMSLKQEGEMISNHRQVEKVDMQQN